MPTYNGPFTGPTRIVPLAERREIVERVLNQAVGWIARDGGEWGYCECPGIQNHNGKNGRRDCRVWATENGSKPPGIHCLHTSCASAVEEMNHRLRSEIGKAKANVPRIPGQHHASSSRNMVRTSRTPAFGVKTEGDSQNRTARTDISKPLMRFARAHVHAHAEQKVQPQPSEPSEVAQPLPQPIKPPPPVLPTPSKKEEGHTEEKTYITFISGDTVERGEYRNGEWVTLKRISP